MWCESRILFANVAKNVADPLLHRPRPPIIASLGTSIAFQLGKLSLAAGGPGPEPIALNLVEQLEQAASGYLAFTVARGGYINIDFSQRGVAAFLEEYSKLPPEKCFQQISVLPWIYCGQSAPPAVLSLDWQAVYDRAAALNDEAGRELRALPESDETRLVILALLADTEFDPRSYLRSLHGKENLPWAFRRFQVELEGMLSRLCSAEEGRDLPGILSKFLSETNERLLWARFEYVTAARHQRPEEFLRYLMDLMRLFYSYFTRPEFRHEFIGPHCAQTAASLRRTLTLLRAVVDEGLRSLKGV